MKKPILSSLFPIAALALSLSTSPVDADSFTYTPALAIPDGNLAGTSDVQTPASIINVIQSVTVGLNISGGFNGDLYTYLRLDTPGGTGLTVLLNRVGKTSGNPAGFSDAGFNITLDGAAATDIHLAGTGASPVVGTYQPDGRNADPNTVLDTTARTAGLSALNGLSAKGTWTLFLADVSGGPSTATLNSYTINISGLSGPFYWKGGTNGLWTGVVNNWAADAAGTTNILATPDSTEEVIFSTTNAANRGTTLGADFTINRLTMADTVGAVQINGANTLTLSGSAGTGIDVQAGALALTIGANVTLAGSSNTINVNNAVGATINGVIGGANGLTKTGTGTLTLGGATTRDAGRPSNN